MSRSYQCQTRQRRIVPDRSSTSLSQGGVRWGTPIAILTDQGTVFENRLFKELCSLLEVKKKRTSVRNPRGNGQTERFNLTLIKMIKSYLVDQQEWDLYLGCVAGAYRASPNETTKLTPNMLCMGREVRMPANIQFRDNAGEPGGTEGSLCSLVIEMRERLRHAHEVVREHIGISARRKKDMYDAGMSFHRYQEGDLIIMVSARDQKEGCDTKVGEDVGWAPASARKAFRGQL